MSQDTFKDAITGGYTFKGESIALGAAILDGEVVTGTMVSLPLSTMNRHGLIAGATGSGKTKTLQIIAEQLSAKGVPTILMDVKGDISGIAMPGVSNPKIEDRQAKIGIPFTPGGSPVEFLSLSHEKGARLRANISEFGPVLFSRILELNDTQSGVLAIIFKYCEDKNWPLIDLDDFRAILQYIGKEGKAEIESKYGQIAPATIGVMLRKIVELETQQANLFFGSPSFDVMDLVRTDYNGKGIVNIIRLTDIQDKPLLFSTFMLQLLSKIYSRFPELGDVEKPKLAIFIDEAHLIFEEASKTLLNMIETIVKLIRSKGVGVYFITQNPEDVPEEVLAQLGMKIQHSLRAFTAKDRAAIKQASQNFPISPFYKIDEVITALGIGEALVTVLNEKGIPTPLAHTLIRAPQSRMDILSDAELDQIISRSYLAGKYAQTQSTVSAKDYVAQKQQQTVYEKPGDKEEEKGILDTILDNPLTKQVTRNVKNTFARELTKGLMNLLGLGKRR